MQAYSYAGQGHSSPMRLRAKGITHAGACCLDSRSRHVFHVRLHVAEVDFQTFAERVFRASVGAAVEAVLGALATAGEVEFAAQAFRGQRVAFVQTEFAAFGRAVDFVERGLGDVAQFVFGVDEVVAGVDVAVVLDDPARRRTSRPSSRRPAARRTTGPARRRTSGRNSGPRRPRPTGRKRRTENARSLRP